MKTRINSSVGHEIITQVKKHRDKLKGTEFCWLAIPKIKSDDDNFK